MPKKTVDVMVAMLVLGFIDFVVIIAYLQAEGFLKFLLGICFAIISILLVAGAYTINKDEK